MSNLSENRLDAVLDARAVTSINAAIVEITGNLPQANLTDVERKRLFALDVDNRVFVEEVITEMEASGANIIPPFIRQANIETDLALFKQMNALESKVLGLLRHVQNLKRISGHEAYSVSLAVYKIYESASTGGITEANVSYANLKRRFESQSPPKPEIEL